MSLNPRNLVVICIDGRGLHNLAVNGIWPGSVPVPGAFEMIRHLVTKCVGVDNVCVMFTDVNWNERKEDINRWLLEQSFFRKTGLRYRARNIVFRPNFDDGGTVAEFVSDELVTDMHGHILVVSDCCSDLSHFEFQNRVVTRILLDPAPEEDAKYVHSKGMYLLREWDDIRVLLPDLLRL